MCTKKEINELSSECFEDIERVEAILALLSEKYLNDKHTYIQLDMAYKTVRTLGDKVVKILEMTKP